MKKLALVLALFFSGVTAMERVDNLRSHKKISLDAVDADIFYADGGKLCAIFYYKNPVKPVAVKTYNDFPKSLWFSDRFDESLKERLNTDYKAYNRNQPTDIVSLDNQLEKVLISQDCYDFLDSGNIEYRFGREGDNPLIRKYILLKDMDRENKNAYRCVFYTSPESTQEEALFCDYNFREQPTKEELQKKYGLKLFPQPKKRLQLPVEPQQPIDQPQEPPVIEEELPPLERIPGYTYSDSYPDSTQPQITTSGAGESQQEKQSNINQINKNSLENESPQNNEKTQQNNAEDNANSSFKIPGSFYISAAAVAAIATVTWWAYNKWIKCWLGSKKNNKKRGGAVS